MKINYTLLDHEGNPKSTQTFEAKVVSFNSELDPRTAIGYFLRHLAQEAEVVFDERDTDEEVRILYFSKERL